MRKTAGTQLVSIADQRAKRQRYQQLAARLAGTTPARALTAPTAPAPITHDVAVEQTPDGLWTATCSCGAFQSKPTAHKPSAKGAATKHRNQTAAPAALAA